MFEWLRVWRLCKRLSSGSDSDRLNAAEALGNLGDARAVEPLIEALRDGETRLRLASAEALGNLEDARAVEPLLEALGDREAKLRLMTAKALGNLGDARAVEPLLKALGDDEPDVRLAAAKSLLKLGDPRAFESLVELLRLGRPTRDSRRDHVHEEAAKLLGDLGDPRAVESLLEALTVNNSSVRRAAADALEKLGETTWKPLMRYDEEATFSCIAASGDPRATDLLIGALGDGWRFVRRAAARALAKLGDSRAIEPLVEALADDDSDVRLAAAKALENLGETKWGLLIRGDGDDFARLSASGDSRAIGHLISAMTGTEHPIRDVSAALATSGDPRVFDVLIAGLHEPNGVVREDVVYALGTLGDPRAIEPLIRALRPGGWRCAPIFQALRELGETKWESLIQGNDDDVTRLAASGDPRATEILVESLRRRDGGYGHRQSLANALGDLGDSQAVGPLILSLGDGPNVRQAAAKALRKLGETIWEPLIRGDREDFSRLATSGDPRAIEPLIVALHSNDITEFQSAAEAVLNIGDPRATKPLIWALGFEKRHDVAARALIGLGAIGKLDEQSIEPLIRMLSDNRERRTIAANVLRSLLSGPSALPIRSSTWRYLRATITSPHRDVPGRPNSSDCSGGHGDTGIGLAFPRKPHAGTHGSTDF